MTVEIEDFQILAVPCSNTYSILQLKVRSNFYGKITTNKKYIITSIWQLNIIY